MIRPFSVLGTKTADFHNGSPLTKPKREDRPARGNSDLLLALAQIGYWGSNDFASGVDLPEFVAGMSIQSEELVNAPSEHQITARRQDPSQRVCVRQRVLPLQFARLGYERPNRSPAPIGTR